MNNDPRDILPGDRVLVYDSSLFKDDISTPLSMAMRPATVVRRYGYHSHWGCSAYLKENLYPGGYDVWKYPDLVDVKFDHRDLESHGHFTDRVKLRG